MANVAIYYRLNKVESIKVVVDYIKKLIRKLEDQHVIKGVFIDQHNDRNEFNKLISSPLSQIEFIYLNERIEDEFDNQLLNELFRGEQFKIILFNEI